MLEFRKLTKYYRNVPVVDNVSFALEHGEVTGYLGPNGSGKSTTVKMLTGLVEPSSGHIYLDGEDIRKDPTGFRRRLGYVPEEAHLYTYLSGLEYLQLTGRLRGLGESVVDRRANELLRLFSLYPYRFTPMSAYSKGMKQRVLISAALLHDPDILVFDEPLSGLDVTSAMMFKHLLAEFARQGKTILYISHVLEVVEKLCANVVILYRGKVMASGSVDDLRNLMSVPSLEEIFAQLVQHEDVEGTARGIAATVRS